MEKEQISTILNIVFFILFVVGTVIILDSVKDAAIGKYDFKVEVRDSYEYLFSFDNNTRTMPRSVECNFNVENIFYRDICLKLMGDQT